MSLSLRHIEVFHAVMTSGSVTQAANMLHTSQPTISRELARCEQLLGICLFERSRGRLRPTAQALQLFEEVQRSYIGLERIVSSAAAIRQFEQGQLNVACLPVFAQSLLPLACRDFMQQHPHTQLTIAPQESPLLEEWLAAQRYDLGLSESNHAPSGCHTETLWQANELCVLPPGHALQAKAVLSPADFQDLSFISLASNDSYRQQLDQVFAEHHIQRRLYLETHSAATICALVAQGLGVTIVNPLTALDYRAQGLIVRRFSIAIPFTLRLIYPQHRPASPLPGRFVESLRWALGEVDRRLGEVMR